MHCLAKSIYSTNQIAMKQRLFVFLFTISVIQSWKSQILFCPPGAEWHYTFSLNGPSNISNERIKYVRDTVIGIETFKVLAHKKFFNVGNTSDNKLTLIKQKGDTVFFRNLATQHNWQILYNFAAVNWKTTVDHLDPGVPGATTTYTTIVDSIKYVTVNGFLLKRLYVRYTDPFGSISFYITERFGSSFFMFSYDCGIGDDTIDSFLCYQDNAFGLKQFTNFSCDYSLAIEKNNLSKLEVGIFPNPTNESISISFSNVNLSNEVEITFTDVSGRRVKQEKQYSEKQLIDVKDLNNGIYILSITSGGKNIYKSKLIKSN
jgi:hypothetical protein